jgi:thiamine monophosphate synthase
MGSTLRRPVISAVTNRRLFDSRDDAACDQLVEWSAAVSKAGVDVLQIRERGLMMQFSCRLVHDIWRGRWQRNAVLVNDRVECSVATGAAGVVYLNRAAVAVVRRMVPDGLLVGRSVHVRATCRRSSGRAAGLSDVRDCLSFGGKPGCGGWREALCQVCLDGAPGAGDWGLTAARG